MKVKLSSDCMFCLIKRQMKEAEKIEDTEKRAEYMRGVLRLISEAEPGETSPVIMSRINKLHRQFMNTPYSFDELKDIYNKLMLRQEQSLRSTIRKASNPLGCALRYAQVGNYIDFGALSEVDDEKLKSLLAGAEDIELDKVTYNSFISDLSEKKTVIYLTDNSGEIVCDKLLIEIIKEMYPHLDITVIVRGEGVLNDATIEDAELVGLTDICRVIDNGTDIAGTHLKAVSDEVREKILQADIIISKGQANYETMSGCELNIYYLFLCKCSWFMKQFGLSQFTGVFTRERSDE